MDTLSHKSVLARGFALVRDGGETGAPIRSAAAIAPGQGLTLQFADGCASVTADGGDGAPRSADPPAPSPRAGKPAKASARAPGAGQGSLF
jgi:exodeoxyribonuclease VII large subunit